MAKKKWTTRTGSGRVYKPKRRRDAGFDDEETAAFLFGVWCPVRSSNVLEMYYDADAQTLTVGFDPSPYGDNTGGNPAYYDYPGVDEDLALAFARAPSKGGAVWDYLIYTNHPYSLSIKHE